MSRSRWNEAKDLEKRHRKTGKRLEQILLTYRGLVDHLLHGIEKSVRVESEGCGKSPRIVEWMARGIKRLIDVALWLRSMMGREAIWKICQSLSVSVEDKVRVRNVVFVILLLNQEGKLHPLLSWGSLGSKKEFFSLSNWMVDELVEKKSMCTGCSLFLWGKDVKTRCGKRKWTFMLECDLANIQWYETSSTNQNESTPLESKQSKSSLCCKNDTVSPAVCHKDDSNQKTKQALNESTFHNETRLQK